MTPDRTDQTTPDDPENVDLGVLSDSGSLDTSGIGILGGQTEQVSVSLPGGNDEDFDDDDVIGDEVAFEAVEIEAVAGSVDDGADVAVLEEWNVEDEPLDATTADDADARSLDVEPITADILIEADAAIDDAARAEASVVDALPVEPIAAEAPLPDASVPATAAVATAAAVPITGSTPTTRRAAQHAEGADRPDRARAVERVVPRSDVTMTSKRLGEFEGGRETADLLTADRLLDPHQIVRPEPEGAWQHFVYSISGRRINLGDGKRAKARKELDRRIAAPLNGGARFVPVLSRKGGVGKTTITTLLGMALADARDDRIIAVDANPDRGTLAERIARSSGKTVRDLVKVRAEVTGYNDISDIVARDETRLDVLASDTDPRVSEAFNDRDYHDVASLAAHYYSIVLTDTGTGIVHSVMGATLDLADQIVIVAGLSVDEARLASETLTWLETNGYATQVRNAVIVLNTARPGTPLVQLDELESHFRSRARSVVRMPYDPHIAAGSAISFRELQPATRQAARELAATVVEGLRSLASAA
ncbi:MinD/ParA family ATP-binding protein [Microbacterium pygmaeum]|uniref:MinD-like ATPase involved in chromosome partitioning or flagellar assembly n=1 Tax=Microbacterium pygmaeum TaxID=370764 RepID=A0A1G8BGJ3_9MICO|nr:MinD/ParA family protein [Microbacterium pygmaeum]SDH32288.1 MinD-like ATPase involved in chromosome partitioning or flagellar assembly [Microbacterium pygmaeum]